MRNLKINSTITTKNDAEITKELQGVLKICIDTLNEVIYFAVGYYKIVAINRQKEIVNTIEVPTEIGIDQSNKLLRFDYHPEDQRLCLVFAGGQILIVHIEEKRVEKIFDLGKRISGCSWSPDLQHLVIASENQLFIVSRIQQDGHQFFKILAETILRPTSLGKDQLVTIGWGSAETQFQGSVGKQNREKTDPNKIPIPIRNEFDDKRVLISWRADGQYFSVSSVDDIIIPKQESPSKNIVVEKMNCRQLRIWNRDLELMSQCEFLSGIEAALCMRPTGNLIAVPRILENERFIWFFERNGQYRNKFKLPNCKEIEDFDLASQTFVDYISWNLDSSILAMLFHDKENGLNQLQFWTVSNYSWTMKLCLNVENELVDQFWDVESANKFHYVTVDGNYTQIQLQFEYNCESILALSINGDNIRVTDFKLATIPPPLCHQNLPLDFCGAPSAFAFSMQFGLAVVGSDFQRMTIFSISDREFKHRSNFKLDNSKLLHNLEWTTANSIRALRNGMDTNLMEIIRINIETEQIEIIQSVNLQIIFSHFILNSAQQQFQWLDNSFLLQSEIVSTDLDENRSLLLGQPTMNLACEQFYQIKKFETAEKETLIFILTNTYLFYANNKKLHSSIGSFCLSKNFLLILTLGSNSNLFCIPIDAILTFLAKDEENANDLFKSGRQVENGAQLICCEGTKVWLQMPRGNLEVISPRELVLDELKVNLDARNWRVAYLEMRRHRVATDLLYDHNPKAFNENVSEFIQQINNVDHINQFLTTLQSEDTTMEMFSAQYPERKEMNKQRKSTGKISGICEKIRNVILNISDDEKQKIHLYPVVLTTFLVEKRISAALLNMRDFLSKLSSADTLTQTIQRWLRHMGYMASEEKLFREALKTYDMEIALMVAQSTNLDPKEYLPILNDIRMKTPDLLRHFHIELFLEDPMAAFEHIAKLVQEEPENSIYLELCLDAVEKHKLHQQALRLFCGKPHYKDICKIAAPTMEKKGFIREAALLYEKADDYLSAQNCLFNIQDFRGFLRLSKLAGQPREKIEPLLKKMVVQLEHRDKFVGAAEILTYLGKETNAEKILDLYSKENAWTKLMEFLNENGGGEFLTNKCRVILSMRCMQIIEKIDEWRDNINKYWKRLEILRKEKAEKLAKICSLDQELDDDGDTSSQSSTSSLNSRNMSTKSARKRQKNERKKQQIKEGSQWEDAAILVALKAIYSSIYQQQDELVELLLALVSLDLVDKGRRLQKEMIEIVTFGNNLIDQIWPIHLYPYHLPGPIRDIYTNHESKDQNGRNVFKLPKNTVIGVGSGKISYPCMLRVNGKFYETMDECDALMPFGLRLEDEILRPKFNSSNNCHWTLNILH